MFLQTLAVPCQFRPSQAQTIGLRVRSHSPREPSLRAGVMRQPAGEAGQPGPPGAEEEQDDERLGAQAWEGRDGRPPWTRGQKKKSAARIQEAADMHRITGKAGGDSLIEMSPTDSFNGE